MDLTRIPEMITFAHALLAESDNINMEILNGFAPSSVSSRFVGGREVTAKRTSTEPLLFW